jgi:hypothetical protein
MSEVGQRDLLAVKIVLGIRKHLGDWAEWLPLLPVWHAPSTPGNAVVLAMGGDLGIA